MTAPAPEDVEQELGDTGLSHKWCLRCVPPPPQLATAFCGFKTPRRRTGVEPALPECVVCADLLPLGCPTCRRGTA